MLFVHGGFWRSEKDSASLLPAVLQVAAATGLAGTVGYRPADDGGTWPRCRDDLVAAVREVWRSTGVRPGRTALVGHSAGGQLALVAADELPGLGAVVGLAAVSDLVAARRDDLGDGAVDVLLGGSDGCGDERLREASPLHRPPPACRVELVHGDVDQAVPIAYSRRLAEQWRRHSPVGLQVVAGARHMHLVNPERRAWATVARTIGIVADALVSDTAAGGPTPGRRGPGPGPDQRRTPGAA